MKKTDYVIVQKNIEAEIVSALYENCGSAGLGLVRALAGAIKRPSERHLSVESARALIDERTESDGSWSIDYLYGRRMKLNCRTHGGKRRLYIAGYDEFAARPARDTINAITAGVALKEI